MINGNRVYKSKKGTSMRSRLVGCGFVALSAIAVLSGCGTFLPNYKLPDNTAEAQFKEAIAANKGAYRGQEKWWEVFGDPKLNELEENAGRGSTQLRAAAARVTQARAVARISDADLLPTVTLQPSATRERLSANRPVQPGSPVAGYSANRFRVPLDVAYEVDIWGKIRNASEAALARADAASDAFYTVMLTLQGDVAQNYFSLRALDAERAILRDTLELRIQGLDFVRARYKGGITNELDVTRAETEFASTEAEMIGIGKRRAELENALAVLQGISPTQFSLPESPLRATPPDVPVGLPSELLQRRPDVAEAERLLAARNAEIGVAKAAFFPSIRLTGQLGLDSGDLSDLLKSPSRVGFFGVGLQLPIFEGGRNKANLERSRAAFEENLAQYRERVLVAFQEVENGLAGLRVLAQQSEAEGRSVSSAKKSTQISNTRYKAGLVPYLEVIDAERTALTNQRLLTQLAGQRLVTSVALIKALGGGWRIGEQTATASPTRKN